MTILTPGAALAASAAIIAIGALFHFVRTARLQQELGELRAERDTLRARLMDDLVTGLANTRYLAAAWSRAAASALRSGDRFALAVIEVEDPLDPGSPLSHAELERVAAELLRLTRTEDHLCRLDGRRFAALLSRCDGAGARAYLDRVRERVGVVRPPDGEHHLYLTVCAGAAVWKRDFGRWHDHLRAALKDLHRDREAMIRRRTAFASGQPASAYTVPVPSDHPVARLRS